MTLLFLRSLSFSKIKSSDTDWPKAHHILKGALTFSFLKRTPQEKTQSLCAIQEGTFRDFIGCRIQFPQSKSPFKTPRLFCKHALFMPLCNVSTFTSPLDSGPTRDILKYFFRGIFPWERKFAHLASPLTNFTKTVINSYKIYTINW